MPKAARRDRVDCEVIDRADTHDVMIRYASVMELGTQADIVDDVLTKDTSTIAARLVARSPEATPCSHGCGRTPAFCAQTPTS